MGDAVPHVAGCSWCCPLALGVVGQSPPRLFGVWNKYKCNLSTAPTPVVWGGALKWGKAATPPLIDRSPVRVSGKDV